MSGAEVNDKKLALYLDMRRLWSDHVIWTREYIIGAIDGTADTAEAAKRLMKNQEDIGAAIVPYYGKEAGDKLTTLLKEHITIAVDLVAAAKTNDTNKFNDANDRWKKNADDIATFLSGANNNWPKDALVDTLNMHLQTTVVEAQARLKKDYVADVKAFDAVFDHILSMSDTLSSGIIKQFPDKF
ncbi:glycosyltransferase [Candidatus Parcubacteria bacterium]|nr:glycosyltransferase [Candidatus Parcubacteria bacterium]